MKKIVIRLARFFFGVGLVFLSMSAFADDSSTLTGFVSNLQTAVLKPVFDIMIAVAYLAGVGFVVAGIFKLKAHKDNPTQITIGTPIFLLGVGVALLFAPGLIETAGKSLGLSSGAGSLNYTGSSVTGSGT